VEIRGKPVARNFIDDEWVESKWEIIDVVNPAGECKNMESIHFDQKDRESLRRRLLNGQYLTIWVSWLRRYHQAKTESV